MTAEPASHWSDVLTLRPEVAASDGSVGELQMSLYKAVYQSVDVPYRKVSYYGDITQPTPNLVGFFARVARRLGTGADSTALFHLDQGMGGGKSHALVGLYHMAHSPEDFFATDLGARVTAEASHGGMTVDLSGTKCVVLTADYFSPGRTNEVFGPATTLFERFLWSLTDGDMDRYLQYVAGGPNKGTLQRALSDTGSPVLILLDELMDYVLQLSDATNIDGMPNEKAFLNALMDACDDVARVAFVVVMIRSELDERGYPPHADDFRAYVAERLVRNGTTVAVTEAQDFASIIQRRLFETTSTSAVAAQLAKQYTVAASGSGWREKVFDKLGPNRGLTGLADRVEASYPFHPELMRLVREEWSQVQNFQRVRSTVAIFARTALHWVNERKSGRWAPALIGVGDIPLTAALEQLLSSGLLMGNDRAIQGYRSVATTDITSSDGTGGRAVAVDQRLRANGVTGKQAHAAVRMATALYCYSIVARPRAGRGATKPELLAAVYEPVPSPGTHYTEAEEVFNALTGEEGLGALEITQSANAASRYYLSIKQTLRMYFTASMSLIDQASRDRLVWEQAQRLARKGYFEEPPRAIDAPSATGPIDVARTFDGIDASSTRLVVLDPRRWTLLNGKDATSRAEIAALLGLGSDGLRVDHAASCVVAVVNTQRRDIARKRAGEVLAWRGVLKQLGSDEADELTEAQQRCSEAEDRLKKDIAKAYQHYVYLVRSADGLHIEFKRFDDDSKSSLRGDDVWTALVEAGRATLPAGLSSNYLAALLDTFDRTLTPKEVVQSFYNNPSFPLVPTTDEIRRAIFRLLSTGWELVDSDGNRLAVASPDQISIGSIGQSLRRIVEADPAPEAHGDEGRPAVPDAGDDGQSGGGEVSPGADDTSGEQPGGDPGKPEGPTLFKRYVLEIANRSITAPDSRERVWQLFKELSKVMDAPGADHQLITVRVTLTTAEGDQGAIEQRTIQAGGRAKVEDDDF